MQRQTKNILCVHACVHVVYMCVHVYTNVDQFSFLPAVDGQFCPISDETLASLKYLRRCAMEGVRLYPVGAAVRMVTKTRTLNVSAGASIRERQSEGGAQGLCTFKILFMYICSQPVAWYPTSSGMIIILNFNSSSGKNTIGNTCCQMTHQGFI